jgi:predicted permease
VKEQVRDVRAGAWLDSLLQDVRYGARTLWNHPTFSVVAVLTLALGVGANCAIFSVITAAILRPLPYPHSSQLVLLFENDVLEPSGGPNVVSFANFADWERQSHSFVAMSAGRQTSFDLGATGPFPPERIDGAIFSWGLFKTLEVQPAMGRAFIADDDRPGAQRVAIISYGLWQGRFGGTSDILNRKIRLDGVDCHIIGVTPQRFGYPTRSVEVWVPIQQILNEPGFYSRGSHQLYVVARVRDGVSIGQATAEVSSIQQRLWRANPGGLLGRGAVSMPLRDITTQESKTSLYALMGAVGCLLLIACVNISNLLLARGSQRSRELAIRAALGASRSRLVQQILAESALLSLVGAMAGLLLAYGLTQALGAHSSLLIQADDIDTSAPIRIDSWVLIFAVCVALLAGVFAGLLPARRSALPDTVGGLREGGRAATTGRGQHRLRTGLVSVEVALSMILLIAAGLMIRSFFELQSVRPGVRTHNVLTAGISLPETGYRSREQISQFGQSLLERLHGLPGVREAGLVTCLPVGGYCGDTTFMIEGHPLPAGQFNVALNRAASPDYFKTAGIPLLEGRTFTDRDGRGFDDKHPQESAVVISESMAKKFWPQGDALGQRIYFDDTPNSPRYRVIGIVGDVLIRLADQTRPTLYTPLLEGGNSDFYAVLYTARSSSVVAPDLRSTIQQLDADIPAFEIRTIGDIMGESADQQGFEAVLFACFAGLALILSAVGLYGVLSYLIAQRTPEIGIRMALGADRTAVSRLVLMQGLRPTFIGLALGLLGAAVFGRIMRSLLFGISPGDLVTFVSVPLLLIVVALVACLVPIYRAVGVDPAVALRSQ